jgi:L,D-transpeptidase catalytic domain
MAAAGTSAQPVVSSTPKPGQSLVLPPVQPAASASPSVAANPAATAAAAAMTPVAAAAATPSAQTAAVAAVPPAATAASPAAPALSASGAAISAAAPPATAGVAQPVAAAQPSVAPTPSLAALTPPGGGAPPMAPTWVSTPAAAATPSASSSTQGSASAGAAAQDHKGQNDQPTAGMIALRDTHDSAIVLNPYSWSVMVYKSQHRLLVYYRGHLYKEYHAVFGRNLDPGTKLWSGDRRTPEGAYTIIAKRLNSRWRYFLKLDYPNSVDRARYEQLVSQGEVPRFRGRAISEGDGIGIHGTDEPILNTGNVNWTTGCISVDNGAIDELETLLPVGTLVVIKH